MTTPSPTSGFLEELGRLATRRRPREPAHQVTTAHLQAAYPFVAEGAIGADGAYIGRDVYGGSFAYDPFCYYDAGLISGPNMLVLGEIGQRKSGLVKSYLLRQSVFGRRAWIVDAKGEYAPLAHALGVQPVRLAPHPHTDGVTLNPLDPLIAGDQQRTLLEAIAGTMLGRVLRQEELAALGLAHGAALQAAAGERRPALLADVVNALLHPAQAAAGELATTPERLREASRETALALRRLGQPPLQGMFDGPTTPGINLDERLVVIDLSAVLAVAEDALPVLMLITSGWLQGAWSRADGLRRIVVLDEAWRVLAHLPTARWLRASWKLARAYGVQMVAVMHRLSDLATAGDAGSEQVALVSGLLADSETRVLYRQTPGERAALRDLLGLSPAEIAYITEHLRPGQALWRIGRRTRVVEHLISPMEQAIVDTDANMRPEAPAAGQPEAATVDLRDDPVDADDVPLPN